MQLLYCIVLVEHSMRNREKSGIRRFRQGGIQILGLHVCFKASIPRVDLSDGLLQAFLECSTNCHDFSHRLHSRTNLAVYLRREFGKIPFGYLSDDIVERRFKASGSGFRNSVGKLRKGMAEGDLSCSVGEGVSRCFRC